MKSLIQSIFASKSELSHRGILTSALGAFVAIICVVFVSRFFVSEQNQLYLVASMGASSIILFTVTNSPMAKPWSLAAGTLMPATLGVFCYQAIPDTLIAIPVAVSLSIVLMFYLRCLHPPGGAAAIIAIIGGDEIHQLGYQFVLTPVAVNVFCILIVFIVYLWVLNQLREYKVQQRSEDWWELPQRKNAAARSGVSHSDLDAALQSLDEYVDINKEDLTHLISLTLAHAEARHLSDKTCAEIVSINNHANNKPSVEFGTELEDVWKILKQNDITAVPVLDRAGYVVGIVSRSDFTSHAKLLDDGGNDSDHSDKKNGDCEKELLKRLITRTSGHESEKPEVAGQIMTVAVITLQSTDKVSDAVSVFRKHQIHSIPIVDGNNKYLGMLNQTHIYGSVT